MARQLALVVDDSKTARVTLKHLLEQQNLDVDTLESAQEALDYLVQHIPDVIFMDHMMPGMDGFEAVEAIKGNPDTATIPIMMYTSKEGDLYVSQARALGAMGILPKHVEPAELFEVLNSLGLAKDRRNKTSRESSVVLMDEAPEVADAPEVAISVESDDIRDIAYEAAEAISGHESANNRLDRLLESYHYEMVGQLQDLRNEFNELSAARSSGGGKAGLLVPLIVFLVMLVPLLWLYNQHMETGNELEAASHKISQQADSQRLHENSNAENATLRAQLEDRESSARLQSQLLFNSIAWAINLSGPYEMREEAFGDQRLAIVQELLTRLNALGFKGTVQLESHLGDFCLSGDDVTGYIQADGGMYASDCSLVGHPNYQLPTLGERQSIAFANFIATSPLVNDSDIRIELVNYHNSRPKLAYPPRHPGVTARDWNRIATANNRVEVTLIADTL